MTSAEFIRGRLPEIYKITDKRQVDPTHVDDELIAVLRAIFADMINTEDMDLDEEDKEEG